MKIIEHSRVLVVEGPDDVNFFKALLRHMGFEESEFEVQKVGGTTNFKDELAALVKQENFNKNVDILAIVRDADRNADSAYESIKNIIKSLELIPPDKMNSYSNSNPRIGIFIMPNNSEEGMLEDLCLRTVRDHPAMKCVNMFVDCTSKLSEPPNKKAKSKALAFLAAMPEFVNSLGVGAQKGYWDFNSEELNELKTFLSEFK